MGLAIVKMRDNGGFAGLYYIGERWTNVDDTIELTLCKPLRFIEIMQPRQVPTRMVGPDGKNQMQTLIEPQFQDLPEVCLQSEITLPTSSIMNWAEIDENSFLNRLYKESWNNKEKILKQATVEDSEARSLDN